MSYIVYSAFVLCCVKIHLMVWNSVNAFRALAMRRPLTHRMICWEGRFSGSTTVVPGSARVAHSTKCQAHYVDMLRVHATFLSIHMDWKETKRGRKQTSEAQFYDGDSLHAQQNIIGILFYQSRFNILLFLSPKCGQTDITARLSPAGRNRSHTDGVFAGRFG